MTLKEAVVDFIKTTDEQTYDEWRELKAFGAGFLIASIMWIVVLIGVL